MVTFLETVVTLSEADLSQATITIGIAPEDITLDNDIIFTVIQTDGNATSQSTSGYS